MKKIYSLLILITTSCVGESSSEKPNAWVGEWTAEWKTPPESPSYRGIEDMEFYMDGKFIFTNDSLTIQNNGYPGCIFAVDTLKHTQSWKVSNDTLFSINDPETRGITYKITSLSENKIELQLIDDIFVTLRK
ncbi:MAG: hypothetical protein AAGI25_19140 [Bacteroidota bacterium]